MGKLNDLYIEGTITHKWKRFPQVCEHHTKRVTLGVRHTRGGAVVLGGEPWQRFCDFKDMIRIQRFFSEPEVGNALCPPSAQLCTCYKHDFPSFERVHKEWLGVTDIVKGNKASEDGQSKTLHLTWPPWSTPSLGQQVRTLPSLAPQKKDSLRSKPTSANHGDTLTKALLWR